MSQAAINVLLGLMIIVSFLISMVLHECAHVVMAAWLGDRTPQAEGRLTLKIGEHIDPVGLLMCVVLAFQPITALPVGLGWGKPVKPDVWKMRIGPNRGLIVIALAGPIFSLLVGLLFGVVLRFTAPYLAIEDSFWPAHLFQFLAVFACTNVALALFNLIPLYPLDGYQIVYALLPNRQSAQFAKSAAYGPFIILAIFFFLPFLAQLARVSNPLFEPAYYIWLGATHLLGLIVPGASTIIEQFYLL